MLIRKLKTEKMMMVGLLILLTALAGCLAKDVVEEKDAAPVADTELSYRNQELLAPSTVPVPVANEIDPGDSDLLKRSFENSPPLISHTTDGYLPITLAENECLECHLPENAVDAEATATPASHLYDIRRGKQLDGLNPANYNCTQCHATQNEVAPLVANTFEPYFRTDDGDSKSNFLDILNDGVE